MVQMPRRIWLLMQGALLHSAAAPAAGALVCAGMSLRNQAIGEQLGRDDLQAHAVCGGRCFEQGLGVGQRLGGAADAGMLGAGQGLAGAADASGMLGILPDGADAEEDLAVDARCTAAAAAAAGAW
jgi:hypothetical protein